MIKLVALAAVAASLCMAQVTSITGKVADTSGGAVVGAKVTATPKGGGVSQSTLTNSSGIFIVPALDAKDYLVRVDMPGFGPIEKTLTLLVGQTITIDLTLRPASTSSTVDVSADAAVIDTSSSQVGGNIDSKQMKDVPLNGRNWMELALLVPGITHNAVGFTPLGTTDSGKFQINVDGQQVTQNSAGSSFGQPQFSRDALDQYQIITNRFDATLGRSSQIQINAQTKSGTNQFHGSGYGYFRNDVFNAADPIAQKVLPFKDQQYGGTIGGPILKDKLWFFFGYEGEHSPGTLFQTPTGFAGQSFTYPTTLKTDSYLLRGDYEINSTNRISVRASGYTWANPFTIAAGGTAHPSRAADQTRTSWSAFATWTRIFGPGIVNEVKGGINHFDWDNEALYPTIEMRFPSNTIGGPYNYPQHFVQNVQQYRDDLFWLAGKHSIKTGGEYLYDKHSGIFQQNLRGTATFTADPASYSAIFPSVDPSTWNLTAISPLASTYVQGFGNFNINIPRNTIGFWAQDDWKITPRLTLNLGLRYDNDIGIFDPSLNLKSGIVTPRSGDNLNFAPRIGFAYDVRNNGKTVIRGGVGKYFSDIQANQVIDQEIFNGQQSIQASVSRTSTSNINLLAPFGATTAAQILSGAVVIPQQAVQILAHDAHTPFSLQASLGAQHQFGKDWTLSADFVHWRVYNDWIRTDANLVYNPATGANVNPTLVPRPNQNFTTILTFTTPNAAGAIYDGLQMELRKRFSHNLSLGTSYTLSRLKDSTTGPFYYPNNQYDLNSEWANSVDDQRHTLSLNASYQLPWGFQTSLFYHFGSGNAYQVTSGGNPFGNGSTTNRTYLATLPVYNDPSHNHPSATVPAYMITDRDQFYGRAIERIDMRLQKTVSIKERVKLIGIFEAFNLLNFQNYGSYNTAITLKSYGAPATNSNLAYAARMLQLAGRVEF
jgi:Carboxypeptidase regulatory-like domain/TonB dependent receptor